MEGTFVIRKTKRIEPCDPPGIYLPWPRKEKEMLKWNQQNI